MENHIEYMEEVYGKASKCRNDWDGEVDCPEVMGSIVSVRKNRLQQLLKD